MSVLIRGMEMPTTCCHCPLMDYDPDIEWNDGGRETQGAYICVLTHELIDNTKCEEHCPLVPVPEPHGRLIDADALVDKHFGKEFLSKVMTADEDDLGAALVNVPLVINNAPTIIPAEEGE